MFARLRVYDRKSRTDSPASYLLASASPAPAATTNAEQTRMELLAMVPSNNTNAPRVRMAIQELGFCNQGLPI